MGAFLFAISPMQVRYAQEARMYALSSWRLAGLGFPVLTPRGELRPEAGRVCRLPGEPGVSPSAGPADGRGARDHLAREPRRVRPSLGRWAVLQMAVLASVAPWVGRYLDHPPEFTVGRLPIKFLIGLPIGFHGGTAGPCGVRRRGGLRRTGDRRCQGRRLRIDHPVGSTSVLIWFAVPPLLLYAHSFVSHPIFGPPRYTLFVGPAWLLLVARGMRKLPRVPRYAVALACAGLAGVLLRTLVYAADVKPDWRSAARVIRQVDPGATVVVLEADPGSIKAIEP
ncbi:MAG: hypothetical protein WKF75_21225, partial [Singulisphaera sp.]